MIRPPLKISAIVVLGLFVSQLAAAQTWAPPDPMSGERDWIMLTSGEWLWGDIKLLQDLNLSFDSEVIDELDLDWDDVIYFRSARVLTYTFSRNRVSTGTAVMQDEVISVKTTTGIDEYPRADLIKIIEGGPRELSLWSMKANVELIVRSGNTDQSVFKTFSKIRREATRTRFDLDYAGTYSKVDDVRTIDNHRIGASWGVTITHGFFAIPLLGELYSDEFQNIDIRSTIGAGLGIWVTREDDVEWNLKLGGVYRDTRYISVEAGEKLRDQAGSIVPATVLEWDITDEIELDIDAVSHIGVPDLDNTTHHVQLLLSVDVWGDILDITTNFTWDRVESPKTNADGITPMRDDFSLAFGLGLDI